MQLDNGENCTASYNGREYLYRTEWMIIFIGGYILVGVASFLGNTLVTVIVIFKHHEHTVTDIFIGALALADLLITMVPLWITPYYHYQQIWKLGQVSCYLFYGLGGAALVWSALILVAMAIDRYLLVVFPTHAKISKKMCLLIIAGLVIMTTLLLTPLLLRVTYFTVTPCYAIYCVHSCSFCHELWFTGEVGVGMEHTRDSASRFAYSIVFLALRTLIPFSVIGFCHWRITIKLSNLQQRLGNCRSEARRLQDNSKHQRLQRLLLTMVFIFAVFTFPLDIFNVIQDSQFSFNYQIHPDYHPVIFLACHLLAMTGTLWNPLVYAYWNENFRREVASAIECNGRLITATQYLSGLVRKDTSAPVDCTYGHHNPTLKETDALLRAGEDMCLRNLTLNVPTGSTRSTPVSSHQASRNELRPMHIVQSPTF